jgi:type I restriction enzyme, R subunit
MAGMSEEQWEQFVMDELAELAWEPKTGTEIAPKAERESWSELIIPWRLRDAIARINPGLPASAVDDAAKLVLAAASRDAVRRTSGCMSS